MAGSRGVPAGHPVSMELSVVLLQLRQAGKGNEAVLARLLCAQEMTLPATCKACQSALAKALDAANMSVPVDSLSTGHPQGLTRT